MNKITKSKMIYKSKIYKLILMIIKYNRISH